MNILVVCHGNVNRSPLAAAVLHLELPWCTISSAGFNKSANRAAKKLRDWASEHHPEYTHYLQHHVPSQISGEMVMGASRVILMDGGNLKRFRDKWPTEEARVRMLGKFIGLERIPDPGFISKLDPRLHDVYTAVVAAAKSFATELRERRT
jgi:protein-tyrosine phosphatase